MELLDAFRFRYAHRLLLEYQPIDSLLRIILKVHARRSADFISLARMTNMLDGRGVKADTETRAKLGRDITLVIDAGGDVTRNSDFNSPAEAFCQAVRVLMYGYCLASAKGPLPETWCDLDGALLHISRVESLCKLDSRCGHAQIGRIREAEMAARSEWARIPQRQPDLNY